MTTALGIDDMPVLARTNDSNSAALAGIICAYKSAGVSAERGADLEAVTEMAKRTVDRTLTLGDALPCAWCRKTVIGSRRG